MSKTPPDDATNVMPINAGATISASTEMQKHSKRPKPSSLPTTLQVTIETPPSTPTHSSSSLPPQIEPSLLPPSSPQQAIKTEILLQLFQDEIFLVLSQRDGKLGALFRCTVEHSVIDNSNTFEVTPLLGGCAGPRNSCGIGDNTSLGVIAQVYARQIMQRLIALDDLSSGGLVDRPPLLLGISLVRGGDGRDTFERIVGKVLDMYKQAIRLVSSSRAVNTEK